MATSTSPPGRVPIEDPSTVVIPEQSSQTLTDSASSETPHTPASNPDRNISTEPKIAEAATSQSTLGHSLYQVGVVTRSGRLVKLSARAKEADM